MLLVIDTLASQITTPNHTMPGRREQKPKLLKRALFNATQRKGNPTAFITTYIEEGGGQSVSISKKAFLVFLSQVWTPGNCLRRFPNWRKLVFGGSLEVFLSRHGTCFLQHGDVCNYAESAKRMTNSGKNGDFHGSNDATKDLQQALRRKKDPRKLQRPEMRPEKARRDLKEEAQAHQAPKRRTKSQKYNIPQIKLMALSEKTRNSLSKTKDLLI